MSKNLKKIGLALLTIIVLGFAFYNFYWVKTPQYSLMIIQKAIQTHNVNSFEQHVNLESIYNKGIDDLLAAGMKGKGVGQIDAFSAGFIQMLKPNLVSWLKGLTLEAVAGNKNANGQSSQTPKTMDPSAVLKQFKFEYKAESENLKIKDVSVVNKDGDFAEVKIVLNDKSLDKNFDLLVKMTKIANGEWQIKEIVNLVNFIEELEKAAKEKEKEVAKDKLSQNNDTGTKDFTSSPVEQTKPANEQSTKYPSVAKSTYVNPTHSSADKEGTYVHSAKLTIDGDTKTCWSEGVPGLGIGESIVINFNGTYKVSGMKIWPGHQKSQDLFYKNARPSAIRVIGSDGSNQLYNIQDIFGQQEINFAQPINVNSVKLIIEKAKPGTTYEDTCISEVLFY